MHPYIHHLLSDIAEAHQNEPSENSYDDDLNEDQAFEKHIEEVERYIAGGETSHTFGYYCGLQSIDFPPPEQLDNDDLKKVCKAFKKMMLTYNLSIDLPDNLPAPFAYKLMVDTLNTKTSISTVGMITFDFCTGYAPDCILKSYCPCLKYWDENEEDTLLDMDESKSKNEDSDSAGRDLGKDELPF